MDPIQQPYLPESPIQPGSSNWKRYLYTAIVLAILIVVAVGAVVMWRAGLFTLAPAAHQDKELPKADKNSSGGDQNSQFKPDENLAVTIGYKKSPILSFHIEALEQTAQQPNQTTYEPAGASLYSILEVFADDGKTVGNYRITIPLTSVVGSSQIIVPITNAKQVQKVVLKTAQGRLLDEAIFWGGSRFL